MTDKLLPCPFCCGEPRVWCDDVTLVACQQEDCPGYRADALVIDWNRRDFSPATIVTGIVAEMATAPSTLDIAAYAHQEAATYAAWLRAGNSTGDLSEHAVEGLEKHFVHVIRHALSVRLGDLSETPTAKTHVQAVDIFQASRDIRILLTQIDWLEEVTGEKLEDEDAQLVEHIRQSWAPTAPEVSDV